MRLVTPSPLLRKALAADALATGVCAVLQVSGAAALQYWLGLPHAVVLQTGLFMIGYTALLTWLALSERVYAWMIMLLVGGNAGWGAAALALLVFGWVQPTTWGVAFVLFHAAAVFVFAGLEYAGLKNSRLASDAFTRDGGVGEHA